MKTRKQLSSSSIASAIIRIRALRCRFSATSTLRIMKTPKQLSCSSIASSITRLRALERRFPANVLRRASAVQRTEARISQKSAGLSHIEFDFEALMVVISVKEEWEEAALATIYEQAEASRMETKNSNLAMVEFVPSNPEPLIILPNINDVEGKDSSDSVHPVIDLDEYQPEVRGQGIAKGQPSSTIVNLASERAGYR